MDGTKFDSSFDRQKTFTFELGVGQVIPGWDKGLDGVCSGEERHLVSILYLQIRSLYLGFF